MNPMDLATNDDRTMTDIFGHSYTPWLTNRWRHDMANLRPLREQPLAHTAAKEYTLAPCFLAIEEITDHPSKADLPNEMAARIEV